MAGVKVHKAGRKSAAGVLLGGGWPRSEILVSRRIEALKDLIVSLLQQLEALTGARELGAGVGNIRLHDEVRRFEIELIQHALARAGGRQRRAARLLGVKVTTLNSKIKRYNIQPPHINDGRIPFVSPNNNF